MNRSAILHIPVSQFAFVQAEDVFTIRLRAAKGDLDSCVLFYGDRACRQSPVRFTELSMERKWQDELYDFFEVSVSPCPKRICYYFRLESGEEKTLYYADEFHRKLPDVICSDGYVLEGRSEYYQYPYILKSEVFHVPEWFENAVVYNIFPDSFADGKRSIPNKGKTVCSADGVVYRSRCGGTINGIMQNLDYIADLGFNCLYLNPVFQAGEYHKYDIVDYFHIDPCMGTDEDFQALTREVHKKGMHIIIDGVFNHCSWNFPYFDDVVEKGENSAYADWFYELDYPVRKPEEGQLPGYACFAYEPKMPKLNTANPKVQEYFAQVGRYWVEKYQVDGWRLDVANEVDKSFWRTFHSAVKGANPEAVLIGEVWENAKDWLGCGLFDSVMNYDFRKHCRDFFAWREIGADGFAYRMTDMQLRYPEQMTRGQLNLLDSHDVPRFLTLVGGDEDRWRLAFLYLSMAPGVPGLFYGDEKLIGGLKEPEYRQAMPWEGRTEETRDFVKTVLGIRRDWIAPAADWRVTEAAAGRGLFVFERRGAHVIRVILNVDETPADVERFHADARMLLEKGTKGNWLSGFGYQVLLVR